MKKTLYIHLGPAKTGTSAIQHFLSSNDTVLSKKGCRYINTLRWDGSHHPLAWIYYHKYLKSYLNILSSEPYIRQKDQLISDLIDEIKNAQEEVFVISSEVFPYLNEDGIDELLSLFKGMSVKGIIYVRDIRELSLSLASQIIKLQEASNDDRLSAIYNNHVRCFNHDYLKWLDLWVSKLGKDNLLFRKFSPAHFKNNNLFADFLDVVNIELTSDFSGTETKTNESLIYNESICFKDMMNKLPLKQYEDCVIKQLLAWEKGSEGTKFILPAESIEKINNDSKNIHKYLLDNYLDESFSGFFDERKPLSVNDEYNFNYSDFTKLLDYMDSNIVNFKDAFFESLIKVLDRNYECERGVKEFDDLFLILKQSDKTIALWGCGSIADRLFKRNILMENNICLIDNNIEKQGKFFHGHEIFPPERLLNNEIDTVIITSIEYTDEIIDEIAKEYPWVKRVVRLSEINLPIYKTSIQHLPLRQQEHVYE